ncbi:hypothetical protein HZS_4970 [Henneguya salminicola]|nr:hypothetical protein HZS_4970 [Henneguya salminicola]
MNELIRSFTDAFYMFKIYSQKKIEIVTEFFKYSHLLRLVSIWKGLKIFLKNGIRPKYQHGSQKATVFLRKYMKEAVVDLKRPSIGFFNHHVIR